MNAVILAAGYAKRLTPHVRSTPKPLLPIAGRPLIELILSRILEVPEIVDVFIVTNNLHLKAFERWAEKLDASRRVHIISDGTNAHHERKGALGDLQFVIQKQQIKSELLVVAGDNFFEFPLDDFVGHFRSLNGTTVALCDLGDPQRLAGRFGVATHDGQTQRITAFSEKPAEPNSSLASTLCYILSAPDLVKLETYLKTNPHADDTGSFLAYLIQERLPLFGYVFKERWTDIGNWDDYLALNQTEVKARLERDRNFSQAQDAVILFADIIASATISEYSSEDAYDDFISEFQTIALRVIKDNFAKHLFDEQDLCFTEVSVRGDEAALILYTKKPKRDVQMAFDTAIELKRDVFLSRFNRSRQGRSFFDVGIGIHYGRVVLKQHPSAAPAGRSFNAEGYSINLTKRIEGHSRKGEFSKIMLSKRFSEQVATPMILSGRQVVPLAGIYGAFPIYELQVVGNLDELEYAANIAREDIDYYVAALENSGFDIWLALMVARHYYDEEDYVTAEKYYMVAKERFKTFGVVYRYLGRNYYRQNKFLEAQQLLTEACELEPFSPRAHSFLAVTLRRLGDYPAAFKEHEKATKYEASSPYEFNAFAYTIAEAWRNRPHDELGDYDLAKAGRYLERAKAQFDTKGDAYAYLLEHTNGMIYMAETEYQKALECFKRALDSIDAQTQIMPRKREEKRGEILYHKGMTYYKMGRQSWGTAHPLLCKSLESTEIAAEERLPYYWFSDARKRISEIEAVMGQNATRGSSGTGP